MGVSFDEFTKLVLLGQEGEAAVNEEATELGR